MAKLEVCVDSVESALAAEQGGAIRVELCADLFEGGLTPSAGMIAMVRKALAIKLHVLVRPRAGDFLYSDLEFEVMRHDVQTCKSLGADGVVLGLLNADGTVDTRRTAQLVQEARPMSVTFHRAFDMVQQPLRALDDIIALGIERLLTSGLESSCLEGLELLTELVKAAGDRIVVMPGGGITQRNVRKIVSTCKAAEVHVSGRVSRDSRMQQRTSHVFMGGALRPPEYSLSVVEAPNIASFINALT
eukprot:TRINITY_DN3968_c1_g3_i1.p2 TRINITY_DN3968_c1_g3~~TRINITY_DN3968_c1_g3_i1.p2  ORF type:complete len:246 (+),score=89.97 TRINITY_DN3968_c1_g3_i1:934-1671(+)